MIIELRKPITEYEILDYEKMIGYELYVKERDPDIYGDCVDLKYWASFSNLDVVEGNFLSGKYGDGGTVNDAIKDYCKRVSNRTLKDSSKQISFEVPKLIHTRFDEVNKICDNLKF